MSIYIYVQYYRNNYFCIKNIRKCKTKIRIKGVDNIGYKVKRYMVQTTEYTDRVHGQSTQKAKHSFNSANIWKRNNHSHLLNIFLFTHNSKRDWKGNIEMRWRSKTIWLIYWTCLMSIFIVKYSHWLFTLAFRCQASQWEAIITLYRLF